MSISRKRIFSLAVLSILFSAQLALNAVIPQAQAAKLLDSQEGFGSGGSIPVKFGVSSEPTDVRVITANIINVFLGLLGIIFVILLIAAGYKWMTAQGNEEQIKEAAGQIKTAIIGLIIVIAAYAVSQFVLREIYGTVKTF
ncbi:hypothetical protein HY798_02815 [Candidatus Falkowbacteria bacterium]|nr:hypothetical protein [Candidatus Falkowbacteria bacterium]